MLYVAVRGKVQGVGFRWFVRERARTLRLTGWVRNREDGSVEVLARGDASALEKLRALLHEGPSGAHVTDVEERTGQPPTEPMNPFGILK
ncbi:MAG: acylphosphatase [Gemmatimonadaceae bacterium]